MPPRRVLCSSPEEQIATATFPCVKRRHALKRSFWCINMEKIQLSPCIFLLFYFFCDKRGKGNTLNLKGRLLNSMGNLSSLYYQELTCGTSYGMKMNPGSELV